MKIKYLAPLFTLLISSCTLNLNFNKVDDKPIISPPETSMNPSTNEPSQTPEVKVTQALQKKSTLESDVSLYFQNKFDRLEEEVNLTISKNTGDFASGGISFKGEMGGGMWFAYKDINESWHVVYDGNGVIPCEAVEPHNFPSTMIPECWDKTNDNLKKL